MEIIKNNNNKTVCRADWNEKSVEIVQKGYKTVVKFLDDGSIRVINSGANKSKNRI